MTGTLLVAMEVVTTEDKAKAEKALISTVCRSPGNFQTDTLANHPAVCGST